MLRCPPLAEVLARAAAELLQKPAKTMAVFLVEQHIELAMRMAETA